MNDILRVTEFVSNLSKHMPSIPMHSSQITVCEVDIGNLCLTQGMEMLCTADRTRAQGTNNVNERSAFVAGRMVLSRLLEHTTGRDAAAIEFSTQNGRPIALECANLTLSVSKSHNRVAAAIATVPMGIDLERVGPHKLNDEVAETMFHPSERARLQTTLKHDSAQEFYKVWTQKEAFSKAHGAGMALDFARICVPGLGGLIELPRDYALNRDWHSKFVECDPDYVLAVVSTLQDPNIEVVSWPITRRD